MTLKNNFNINELANISLDVFLSNVRQLIPKAKGVNTNS